MWKNNVIFVFLFMSCALPTVAWLDGSQEHKDFSQSKVHGFEKTDFEDLTKRQKAKVFKKDPILPVEPKIVYFI